VALAISTFGDILRGLRINIFIDNAADLFAFLKCNARNAQMGGICNECVLAWRELGCSTFYNYVASEANCADWPTREDREHLQRAFEKRFNVQVRKPVLKSRVMEMIREGKGKVLNDASHE
jgi:hypothetical protein